MKIVLFHPRGYSLIPGKRPMSALACIMPPIGIASIAAVLEKGGHNVLIIDAALEYTVSNSIFADRIVSFRPDFIGFSATTAGFNDAYDVCLKVKERDTSIKTVFGGVHVSWGKQDLLKKYSAIDTIIAGEGETAFLALVNGTDNYQSVITRVGDRIVVGENPVPPCELDDLPFPAYHLLGGFPKKYLMPLFGYPRHPGANIISSRGCVYECTYCDRSVFGKSFRWNSPEYTFEQIQMLNKDFGVRHVNFYDDLFTLNRNRVAELCERLASSRLPVTFNCIVRIGHIDKELIHLLKKGGCWMVSVGVESGDQSMLDSHKDGLSLEMIRRDIEFLHKSGLWVKGLFMMGFPGETEESIIKTRDFACSLPLKDANMTAFTPFPGAPISRDLHKSGLVENDWSKMNCVDFVFVPETIQSKAVLEMHYNNFFRTFYNRPFMRRTVYPSLLTQSPHSFLRLLKNGFDFFTYIKAMS